MTKIKPGIAFRGLHVCSLDVGLSDLTRRQQRDYETVLAVLRRAGRFSAFEASANPDIGATMTALCRDRLTTDKTTPYPWVRIIAIDGVPLTRAATKERRT